VSRSAIKIERRYLYTPAIILVFFLVVAYTLVNRWAIHDSRQFATHATIIADDIWALNDSGAKAYLQLALHANHYKSLSVSIPGNDAYLTLTSPPLSGLDYILHEFHLIPVKQLTRDIVYQNQIIGQLSGEQYVRIIFPLFNLLIFFLLLLLTCLFIVAMFINRNRLEELVLERTRNLRESERRFHDLVNLLPEMVLETDTAGRITYANKTAKDSLQLNRYDEPPTLFEFLPENDRDAGNTQFRQVLQTSRTRLRELEAIGPDGESFPVLVRSSAIVKNNTVVGSRMIVVDITERRRLEEELHRDQKMKAIGLMAGGVAHDLNNILSGIISYPELLLLDLDKDDPLRPDLEAIHRAGLDAADVVSDLLTVARGITVSKESLQINKLIRDYFSSPDFRQLKADYPQIVFNVSLAEDLPPILCSPIHVRKCLMNLITNGLEAITGNGFLTLVSSSHEQPRDEIRNSQTFKAGLYVKIHIQDSGSGISTNEIAHIFEPFYTKKVMGRSGTGLGLAIVWNTMRDHGGIVDLTSSPAGTTFELFFPAGGDSGEATIRQPDWRTFQGNREKVLVIDDEARQREITRNMLLMLNFDVEAVQSGEEAVNYLKSHHADILVLDMIMAPGINGRETYEQVLTFRQGQKAIIASGYAEDEDVKATLAMGAGGYLAKPFTLGQLGKAISSTLHPHGAKRARSSAI